MERTAQSANAPIAYGAVWTIAASNEWPFRYPKKAVPSSATPTALADEFAFADPGERFELLIDIFVDGLARRAGA